MKIVFLTKTGHAPTKNFAERLLRENIRAVPGEEIATLAGVAYMDPQVLRAGIKIGEVDHVFVITPLSFPPSAYNLADIDGPALDGYGKALEGARIGETAWDVAARFIRDNTKE